MLPPRPHDRDPARETAGVFQRHLADGGRGVADVVGQFDLDQLGDEFRRGEQVAKTDTAQRPGFGQGPEQDDVQVRPHQRPVVVAAELAVRVVEQEGRVERPRQTLHDFGISRCPGRVVRRAQEHGPPRVALDFGLELFRLQA